MRELNNNVGIGGRAA